MIIPFWLMAVRTPGAPPLPNFTPKQRAHIQSYLPLFTAYLQEFNPAVANYHKGTSEWMSKNSKDVLSNELFSMTELNGRDPAKVELVRDLTVSCFSHLTYL